MIRATSRSDRGIVRKDNQDSVLVLRQRGLYVIADGMGGGSEGALASKMVCEALGKCGVHGSGKECRRRLSEAVDRANVEIGEYVRCHGLRQMGSTVAMLVLDEEATELAQVGHAGDSRVYRIRGGVARQLTTDHTIGAELAAKVCDAEGVKFSMRSNPLAHVLTRAIGTDPKVEVEWLEVDVRAGDRFLVCSDGVHDVIETDELGEIVSGDDVEKTADALAEAVIDRGAPDNYSFVLVDIGDAK